MPSEIAVACSWSGGKDSCYALMQAAGRGAVPRILVSVMNENGVISRSHGLPLALLQQQADAMQVPIIAIPSSWKEYEKNFTNTLQQINLAYNVEEIVFGDIDLQAHRDWEEMVCGKAGLKALLPLWKCDRKELLVKMLESGIKAIIVSCNATLGEAFLGRWLDHSIIPELEARGVDVCGENGEFHTLVTDCPLFQKPVRLPSFLKTQYEGFFFLQWDGS